MIKQLKYKNVLWLDVDKPSHEELEDLIIKGFINPEALFNIEKPEYKPKFLNYPDGAYLSLPSTDEDSAQTEIKFWLKKDTLITIHYKSLPLINDFAQILSSNPNHKRDKDFYSGQLFYLLLCKIYLPLENRLLGNKDELKKIEKNIFKTKSPEITKQLSTTGELLAETEASLKGQKPILESLGYWGKTFWGGKFSRYQEAIIDEYDHLISLAEENQNVAKRLKEANLLLNTTRQQRGLQILSVLIITFLLFLFISIILNLN